MVQARTYSPQTLDAVRLLGLEIARERRARRWTAQQLGERAGVSRVTVLAAEKGSVTVAIGTCFELAALLGIDLFAPPERLTGLLNRSQERLSLLPSRVRQSSAPIDDDF